MDDHEATPQGIGGRRRFLAGVAGAAAAWIGAAVTLPGVTSAAKRPDANGDYVRVGSSASGTSTTTITNSSRSGGQAGIKGVGPLGVVGVATLSSSATAGVKGTSTGSSYGVFSDGKLGTSSVLELAVMSTPSAPPSDRAYLYAKTDSRGRIVVAVRFPDGSERILATN